MTTLLIVTDIYGRSSHIDELKVTLPRHFNTIHIISPYTSDDSFDGVEQQRYQHFIDSIGHDGYKERVADSLRQLKNEPVIVLAFSAGGTAAWRALQENRYLCQRLIAFYPGQLRHYHQLAPNCPTTILMAAKEQHFDTNLLSGQLNEHSNVNCQITPWLHGYCNPLSQHFDQQGYQAMLTMLSEFACLSTNH